MNVYDEAVYRMMRKAFLRLAGALKGLSDALSEGFYPLYLAKQRADQNLMIATSPCSGRVKHLARYAKKRRVRKKNLNRIRKEHERCARLPAPEE